MGDSDNENDKFVKNVMHELSAFQRTDNAPEETDATVNNAEPQKEADKPPAGVIESASNESDPPKPPSRIIRLSRPLQPYGTARASLSSSSASSDPKSTPTPSSSTSTTTGSVNGVAPATSSTPAPGSRLAALQRPGSPMHKFLQRTQSPALSAAARITRQNSADTSNTATTNAKSDNDQSSTANTADNVNTNSNGNTNGTESGETRQPRTSIPRISSSGVTGSILLRRPQSPLRTGRTSQLLLNRPQSVAGGELLTASLSTKSPSSEDPASPTNVHASFDGSQTTDKVDIKNKLRANSFRLKDLLTKRPFVKRREPSESANKEEAMPKLTEPNKVFPKESEKSEDDKIGSDAREGSASPRDRTRWRVEGSALPIRSRISERTATLVSARSLRRSKTSIEASDRPKLEHSQGNSASVAASDIVKTETDNDTVNQSLNNHDTSDNHDNSEGNNRNIGINEVDKSNVQNMENTGSGSETRVTVGATLIRSPRTRTISNSNVPSSVSETNRSEISDGQNTDTIVRNVNDTPQNNADPEHREKAISELEMKNKGDVNLVFNSEQMGQTDTSSIPHITGHDRRELLMSQSVDMGSTSQKVEPPKHRIQSEPASPMMEGPSLRESRSCDTTLDGDFSRSSPALKRSLAVTDLDKAMRDRDHQKLSSIFNSGDNDNKGQPEPEQRVEKPPVPGTVEHHEETDLDAPRTPLHRVSHSPRIQHKMCWSHEERHSPPPSPLVQAVAPMVYKPNVNLEDAVKWPIDVPGKLDFRKMEVFEGQMLLNWLSGSIDKAHYLRLVMTKHDINVIVCQICTCLIAAGVMKQLQGKDNETVFKTDCMYYWTHTQPTTSGSNVNPDVNKLTPSWPPTQDQSHDTKPGLKYTEADHQGAMVTLRHEYKQEVEHIQTENKGVLDKAREEYETRLQQAIERIVLLQKEVEKYKCLAGLEKLSQDALSDADAARLEAGLLPDGFPTNGYSTPGQTSTPSLSQYHTPAVTPDCVSGTYPVNVEKSPWDLFQDLSTPAELEPGEMGPPAPPPPPPPPAPPAPPPPPSMVHRVSKKPVVQTKSPMRQLFWQRIQVHDIKVPRNKEYMDRRLVWEEIEEEQINIIELDHLFSKTNIAPSKRFSPVKSKNKAKQVAKVISPKRSQTIGILLSSLRIDMSDIEYAILNFDTSQISEEKLRQIYENRGDADEMKKLKEYVKKHPDTPLDKPDQFLFELSLIPDCSERIFCFIFREAFQESISVIESKMTNLRMTCQCLQTSVHVRRILGLVLALGNYMNGGSKSRGQADGFGIEILPKLKDVKSKDSSMSLLYFTVLQYIRKFEGQNAGTEKVKLPLPDPSDMNQASLVHFGELDKELKRIKKDFEGAEERAAKVIHSAREHHYLQPFKDIMTKFFEEGAKELAEQEENIADGKKIFQEAVLFFCVKPNSGDKEVTPEYFFSLWTSFCHDFKENWKREQQKTVKMKIRENELRVKQLQSNLVKKQPVRTRTRKAGGLKDRLSKQGLLES